jgi:membrane fusion protein, multidrug efflux system
MNKNLFFILLMIPSLAVLSGCSKTAEGTERDLTVGKPEVPVETTKVEASEITESIEVIGSLEPKSQADVKSEYPGIVSEVYVTEWIQVKKGDPLARVDTRELETLFQKARAGRETARANLLRADAEASRAMREYERTLKMKEAGLVTQQMVDDAKTAKEAADAGSSAAQAQLNMAESELTQTETLLSKTTIRAPIDGFVALAAPHVGDAVGGMTAKDPDFKIVDNRVLKLTVTVPSSKISTLSLDQPVSFTTDAVPGKTFEGKVKFINPVVTESSRSVKVTVEVDNSDESLRGGLFVNGRIITGTREDVIQIPRNALLSWNLIEKKANLFVLNGTTALAKSVQTGSTSGNSVEITAGLAPGEEIITRGAFNVRDGDRVKVIQ